MTHLHAKKINKEIEETFVADSGYTSHKVNSIKNMKNPQQAKTIAKTGNKKTMMGLI